MAMEIHRRDIQEVNKTQDKAPAQVRRETEFATLLKTLTEKKAPTTNERIKNAVANASQKYNLDPNLVYAVIKQESGFKPCAESHCGAEGLMQLMPGTARELGVTDSFDIDQNVDGGCKYLRQMLDRFGGNVRLALAAYNAGPGAVEKYDGIPPYEETRNYVTSILAHYEKFSGGAPLPEMNTVPAMRIGPADAARLDAQLVASAAIANAIASTPAPLKLPDRKRWVNEEPPPPPPPPRNAVRV
jgi:hypothetical protein